MAKRHNHSRQHSRPAGVRSAEGEKLVMLCPVDLENYIKIAAIVARDEAFCIHTDEFGDQMCDSPPTYVIVGWAGDDDGGTHGVFSFSCEEHIGYALGTEE